MYMGQFTWYAGWVNVYGQCTWYAGWVNVHGANAHGTLDRLMYMRANVHGTPVELMYTGGGANAHGTPVHVEIHALYGK